MKFKMIAILTLFLLLIGCNKENSLGNSDATMLEAKAINFGLVDSTSDFLDTRKYTLTYDGQLEYHENFNLSGIKNRQKEKISKEDLEDIYNLLESISKSQHGKIDAYDGVNWNMSFYKSDCVLIDTYDGYIYGSDREEVMEILDEYLDLSPM